MKYVAAGLPRQGKARDIALNAANIIDQNHILSTRNRLIGSMLATFVISLRNIASARSAASVLSLPAKTYSAVQTASISTEHGRKDTTNN